MKIDLIDTVPASELDQWKEHPDFFDIIVDEERGILIWESSGLPVRKWLHIPPGCFSD